MQDPTMDVELLMYFLRGTRKYTVPQLLEAGADPFYHMYGQQTPMWLAIESEDWDSITAMFDQWASSPRPSWRMRDMMYKLLTIDRWDDLMELSYMLKAVSHVHPTIKSISNEFSPDNIMKCRDESLDA